MGVTRQRQNHRPRVHRAVAIVAALAAMVVGAAVFAAGRARQAPPADGWAGKTGRPASVNAAKGPALLRPEAGVIAGAVVQRDAVDRRIRRVRGRITVTTARTPRDMADRFLAANGKLLGAVGPYAGLRRVREVDSLTGFHVTYRQFAGDLPVFGGQVSVHMDKSPAITLVNVDLVPVAPAIDAPMRPDNGQAAIAAGLAAVRVVKASAAPPNAEAGVWVSGQKPVVAWRITFDATEPAGAWVVMVRASDLKVLSVVNDARFDDGQGMVFIPNPIVSTGDSTLTDNDDADSPTLTAARVQVTLPGLDGSGYLTGTYCTTAPSQAITRAYSPTLQFSFLRSADGFEETMAYYHVDRSVRYMQSLGFFNIQNRQTGVDVNGVPDANAWYSPWSGNITFGTGGVDFAEDADVIWHEFGHAIQDNQVPGFGATLEGGAMGEGFGDYWPSSQFAGTGPRGHDWDIYLGEWVSSAWVAGDPPYTRRLDSTKHYPEDMVGEVHYDGEIWSASLWLIRGLVGQVRSDTMILESHYYLSPYATFEDGALAILEANRNLYGDADRRSIRGVFIDRGILTGEIVTALDVPEVTAPVDSTATLTATLTRTDTGEPVSGKAVSIRLDGTLVATPTTDALGVASALYALPRFVHLGDKVLTAAFAGDYDYALSSGAAVFHVTGYSLGGTVTDGGVGLGGASIKIVGPGEAQDSGSAVLHALIPDANDTGITSTIDMSGVGTVTAVQVGVNITHAWRGDLEVALVHPDGTAVLLHNRGGGSDDDLITSYPDLTLPAESLSVLEGKASNGAWSLRVRDLEAPDAGILNSWSLTVWRGSESVTSTVTTDPAGAYSAGGLTSGSYTLTPTKPGFGFSPVSQTAVTPPSRTDVDFATTCEATMLSTDGVVCQLGDVVNLSAVLARRADSTPIDGRWVTFAIDGSPVGGASTQADGRATLSFTIPDTLAPGAHTLLAAFGGDAPLNPSEDAAALQVTGYSVSGTVRGAAGTGAPGVLVTAARTMNRTLTYNATPAATIPDHLPTGIRSTLQVPDPGILSDIKVAVHITHTYIGDLVVTLIHPDGTEVMLHNMSGADADDINTSYPDLTVPAASLAVLMGKEVQGNWRLRVADMFSGDTGTLDNWGLTLTFTGSAAAGSATTAADGTYTIPDLHALPHTITPSRDGCSFTPTSRSVTIGSDVTGVDFTSNILNTVVLVWPQTGAIGGSVNLVAALEVMPGGLYLAGKVLTVAVDGVPVGSAVTDEFGNVRVPYTIDEGAGAGVRVISAAFAGAGVYNPSSGTSTLTVTGAPTTLSVADGTGSPGTAVSLSATLTRTVDGAPVEGRTVSFAVEGTGVGSGTTEASGTASVPWIVPEGAGARAIAAAFAGDAVYGASNGAGTFTVRAADTTLVLDPAAGGLGATVTLSATLRRGTDGALLTGRSVAFSVDGTAVGSATTDASGTAAVGFRIPGDMGVGTKATEASFAGDADYNGSSGSSTLTVSKADTTLYTIDRAGTATETVIFRQYDLKRTANNALLAGKPIVFKVDGTAVGSRTTDAGGDSNLVWTIPAGPASRTITAAFDGDADNNACSDDAVLTVAEWATLMVGFDRTARITQRTELKARLLRSDQLALPNKPIDFSVDGTFVITRQTDGQGYAKYAYYDVPAGAGAGARTILSSWAGNAGYRPASTTATLTVLRALPYIWVQPRTVPHGGKAGLYAYFRRLVDYQKQTGKQVTFRVDGTSVQTVTTDGNGVARYLYQTVEAVGGHTIRCEFAGDAWVEAGFGDAVLTIR